MSKSSVYYNSLNMDAVRFSEACLIIRARIVEAAETMAHIDVHGVFPAKMKSFWPDTMPVNVGPHDSGYGYNEVKNRYRPDAKAISRAEEVFYKWFPNVPDDHRPLLCTWAFCIGARKKFGSFGKFCKKNGQIRRTAERHINDIIQNIAADIFKNAQSLQQPSWKRVSQLLPKSVIQIDKMATVTHWMADDAKPTIQPALQEVA